MADIWPVLPQFPSGPYTITREFRTEIIVSRAGKEQRRALRDTPRKKIEYLSRVKGDCRVEFDKAMLDAQRVQQVIPERVRFVTLSGISSGVDTVTIDPLPAWIVEDADLMLVSGADQGRRTVSSIAGNDVTFTETDAFDWPAGTRLHPALFGYLSAQIGTSLLSRDKGVVEVSVSLDVDPGTEEEEAEGTAGTTLSNREVFLVAPDRWSPPSVNRQQDGVGAVDYGFGRTSRFFPIEFSSRVWNAEYTACSFTKAEDIRKLFARMKGRRGEFYMPTFTADMSLASALTSAGTTMLVTGTDIANNYSGDTVYKAVAVRLKNGTTLVNTVSSIAISSGNSSLTVGTAWGQNVAISDVEQVCWMPVWRFASDILAIRWVREDAAQISLSLQTIENLTAET